MCDFDFCDDEFIDDEDDALEVVSNDDDFDPDDEDCLDDCYRLETDPAKYDDEDYEFVE